MRYDIKYGPAFSLLEMELDHGEEVQCESGAMVSMSGNLDLSARMGGGSGGGGFLGRALGAAARAALGGESFFVTTIKAPKGAGHLALAPSIPGDIEAVGLEGRGLIVQGGSYLASSPGVNVEAGWGGLKTLLGGEGLFVLRTTGNGVIFLASFGAIYTRDLAAGETYIVDSGHMVAYMDSMAVQARMAGGSNSGFFKRALNAATTGEGLVLEFTGPGRVWIQTRNPDAFSSWLYKLLPKPGNSSN